MSCRLDMPSDDAPVNVERSAVSDVHSSDDVSISDDVSVNDNNGSDQDKI